ncbi:MAG: 4-hydroxy-tetrahydrodipicolinate synthase [Streptococcaceae bacterium]|jgi:4-hydroxy-tetrahydrodipicolinate synthase|nr:4-hydroxy-tetrahydrodipicolinate synthase [Streptococcaceae bacterium]
MKKIQGVIVALVTPMKSDFSVDFDGLAELIEFQIAAGIDGILLVGTTGESPTLTADEELEIVRFAIDKIAGRVVVMVGAGSNATAESLEKIRNYGALSGIDALLCITPYYNRTSDAGMLAHFTALADAAKQPIVLYNVPGRTGCQISLPVLRALASHPNIVGLKEASGDMGYASAAARLISDDFALFSGNDDLNLLFLALGAAGVISVWANIQPRAVAALVKSFASGHLQDARDNQLLHLDLIHALFSETNPIPVKAALAHLGLPAGPLRMPLVALSGEKLSALTELLEDDE